ncbi:MAG: hypothetical protein LBN24_03475 [Mediterranea sp.]|jgi:hypothetical protein|nr:hypothetical protein [Mediterranea sp.]
MRKKMKRNVFYLITAFALSLGLGACSSDDDGGSNNGNVVPGREGMVTYRVATSLDQGASVNTRSAQNAPIHFTNDLGNGYVLESTLTINEKPKTRAKVTVNNTYLLMVAFDVSDKDNPVVKGCETLQTGADGTVTFELPKGSKYKLVFYAPNDGKALKPTDYITGGGVADTYTASTWQSLEGATLKKNVVAIPSPASPTYEGDACDAICAATTVDTSSTTKIQLHFKHLFAQINWKIVSDKADGNTVTENIGALSVGFNPRYASAKLADLSAMPETSTSTGGAVTVTSTELQAVWTGSTVEATAGNHWSDSSTDNDLSGKTVYSSVFIPVSTSKGAWIYIKSLTFATISYNYNKGTESKPTPTLTTVTDYAIPILISSGDAQIGFEPGNTYTVTSKLSNGNVLHKFAYSNIFWDDKLQNLNFYKAKDELYNTTSTFTYSGNEGGMIGVRFALGSLIGIGFANGNWSTTNTVYVPDPDSDNPTTTSTGKFSIATGFSLSDDMPYHYYGITNPSISSSPVGTLYKDGKSWMGDICAVLTHGEWRLPTHEEMKNLAGYLYLAKDNTTGGSTPEALVTGQWNVIKAGGGYGHTYDNSFYLPFAGDRDPTSVETSLGSLGAYLFNSTDGDVGMFLLNRSIIWFVNGNPTAQQLTPIRCVKNTLLITNPEDGVTGTGTITQ